MLSAWHARLGPADRNVFKKMARGSAVHGIKVSKARPMNNHSPPAERTTTTRPTHSRITLETWLSAVFHTDFAEMRVASVDRAAHSVTLIGEAFGRVSPYHINTKSEAAE